MSTASVNRATTPASGLPDALARRFEATIVDWDVTITGPPGDPATLRPVMVQLCDLGFDLAIITGTDIADLDARLGVRPRGPGRLLLCTRHGSEVHEVAGSGPALLHRREVTEAEIAALDTAAELAARHFGQLGLRVNVIAGAGHRRRIELSTEPGLQTLRELTGLARTAAGTAGLPHARVTSNPGYIEIGLTDKADAARWVLADLWDRGVDASAVLLAGDEFGELRGVSGRHSLLLVSRAAQASAVSAGAEPGGSSRRVFAIGGPELVPLILADQLQHRLRAEVPVADPATDWRMSVEGFDPGLTRVHESLLTLADGRLGTRGSPVAGNGTTTPAVFLAGVYEGHGPEAELAPLPPWSRLSEQDALRPHRRTMDLHTGVLYEQGPFTSLRFSSLARPGTVMMRVTGDQALLPPDGRRTEGTAARAAFRDVRHGMVLDRIGAYHPEEPAARAALADAETAGFERLLREHRQAWARRWQEADIVIDGDPELQRAVRFALFHLMASVADREEAAVGARGLSGPAYRGHVFWDSDVFVLPFLAATHPAAARAMLEYRVRRLPAARAAARRLGRAGARFPWESAANGEDATPTKMWNPKGELVTVRTGELEEHIVADVAWAAGCYLDWTGDVEFTAGAGRDLLVDTARYWASRVRLDGAGRAHIDNVIGPDEYHESVNDNAFTNVMARWNLRRAVDSEGVPADERAGWRAIADALVDGYDPRSGLYEQFAGFFGLEPIVVAEISPRRPIAADLLFGAERTARAQVVKQADVLMLHHLVPDEVAPNSLLENLDFYEPRTAHGSSLSPAVHAALFARAGRFEPALHWLQVAARMDLDDLTGSTAGGLHLATMGGLWQALAYGFAGVRLRAGRMIIDPRLPPRWNALELGLRYRGEPFRLRIRADQVEIASAALELHREADHWEVRPR